MHCHASAQTICFRACDLWQTISHKVHDLLHFNMEKFLLFSLLDYFNHNMKQCSFYSVNIRIRLTNLSYLLKKISLQKTFPENIEKETSRKPPQKASQFYFLKTFLQTTHIVVSFQIWQVKPYQLNSSALV